MEDQDRNVITYKRERRYNKDGSLAWSSGWSATYSRKKDPTINYLTIPKTDNSKLDEAIKAMWKRREQNNPQFDYENDWPLRKYKFRVIEFSARKHRLQQGWIQSRYNDDEMMVSEKQQEVLGKLIEEAEDELYQETIQAHNDDPTHDPYVFWRAINEELDKPIARILFKRKVWRIFWKYLPPLLLIIGIILLTTFLVRKTRQKFKNLYPNLLH